MSLWKQHSKEFELAAALLLKRQFYRSSVNRFYYAAYALATDRLVRLGHNFKTGRDGPEHIQLPNLIITNIKTLPTGERVRAARLAARLYAMRCRADYRPADAIGAVDCRLAAQMFYKFSEIL